MKDGVTVLRFEVWYPLNLLAGSRPARVLKQADPREVLESKSSRKDEAESPSALLILVSPPFGVSEENLTISIAR